MIRDEVLFQHEYLGHLPPQVQALVRRGIRGRELRPADYDQLFRIAKKIERLPPEQAADYAAKIGLVRDYLALVVYPNIDRMYDRDPELRAALVALRNRAHQVRVPGPAARALAAYVDDILDKFYR